MCVFLGVNTHSRKDFESKISHCQKSFYILAVPVGVNAPMLSKWCSTFANGSKSTHQELSYKESLSKKMLISYFFCLIKTAIEHVGALFQFQFSRETVMSCDLWGVESALSLHVDMMYLLYRQGGRQPLPRWRPRYGPCSHTHYCDYSDRLRTDWLLVVHQKQTQTYVPSV